MSRERTMKRAAARRASAAEKPGNAVGNKRTLGQSIIEWVKMTQELERVVEEHDKRIAELEAARVVGIPSFGVIPDATGKDPTP